MTKRFFTELFVNNSKDARNYATLSEKIKANGEDVLGYLSSLLSWCDKGRKVRENHVFHRGNLCKLFVLNLETSLPLSYRIFYHWTWATPTPQQYVTIKFGIGNKKFHIKQQNVFS